MNTNSYPIIIHGSENSIDTDAFVLVDKALDFKTAKALCDSYKDINANLVYVDRGQVVWCYKGTVDECNNSMLSTYSLHPQTHDLPITHPVERQCGLKLIRCIRGLLSYQSRTALRADVKKALSSPDLDYKFSVLKQIDLNQVLDFGKASTLETYKFLAFQMGQTRALLEDKIELFTKNSVASYYPSLRPYLERQPHSPTALQAFLTQFIDSMSSTYKKAERHDYYVMNFHGVKEIIDVGMERVLPPVVVFDLDGTLMDETHRAHLRESKSWEAYFLASRDDTPIAHIVELNQQYRAQGYEIWLVSGRGEIATEATIASMREHGIEYDHMKLRGEGNYKPDYLVKPGWFANLIGLERIEVAYDDTDKVIEALTNRGVKVVDVKTLGANVVATPSGKYSAKPTI